MMGADDNPAPRHSDQADVVAIVLAAGRSERMGRPKLHLPWGTSSVLGATLATLRAGGIDAIIVVARQEDDAAARTADAFAARLAVAPEGEETPTRSLQAGLAVMAAMMATVALTRREQAPPLEEDGEHTSAPSVMVLPGDLPLIAASTITAVLDAYAADANATHRIFAAARNGRRGHPVLFGAAHVPALGALAANERPRVVVRGAAEGVVRLVDVRDDGIFADIDDEATYERLRPKGAERG